jgi:hypothetical protein
MQNEPLLHINGLKLSRDTRRKRTNLQNCQGSNENMKDLQETIQALQVANRTVTVSSLGPRIAFSNALGRKRAASAVGLRR